MTKHRARTSDEPALDPRVRRLFAAAAAPVETTSPLPGEEEALAAFRRSPQRTRMSSRLPAAVSAKAAVAAAIGAGVMLTGGVGAAAAGILPGPAQQTASTVLETVGISVPAGDGSHQNGRPDQPPGDRTDDNDRPGQTPGDRADDSADVPPAADHGKEVSTTAKNATADGAHKGKDIARVASDGRAKPGNHGSAGEHHGQPPGSHPNSGGTGPASGAANGQEQSAGAADHGTASGNEAGNGASSGGSDNGPANH